MNQPNFSVMAQKNAPAAESPDMLAMVRRYLWLLVAGAAVGSGVGWGLYYYFMHNAPEFTARIPFQVMPPPTPIGQENNQQVVMNADDTAQLINRQKFIFEQESFLAKIRDSDEFHPKDAPNNETPWLTRHKSDVMKYLKRDLRVEPRVNAGAFELTFTSLDGNEAQRLVQAAAKEYLEFLKNQSKTVNSAHLSSMGEAVRTADDDYKVKREELSAIGKRDQIDVLKAGFEIQKNALQGLNDDYTKADAAAASAEAGWNTFQERRDSLRKSGNAVGTPAATQDLSATKPAAMSDLEVADVVLPLDMKQYVENDFNLRTLLNTRASWEQEKVAELSKLGLTPKDAASATTTGTGRSPMASMLRVAEIDARLSKIDDQVTETRNKLKTDALQRMEKTLKDDATSKRLLAGYIGAIRKEKEKDVNDLGQKLLAWDQQVSDVKQLQDSVNKMKAQLLLEKANQSTDDTRIKAIIDPASTPIPDMPSWPHWYTFISLGSLAGLGLSALISYMLFVTDKRVRTPRDISRTLQLPTLGFVPDETDDRILTGDVETAILNSPSSMVAESFRQIRSQITAQTAHNPVNTLVVASVAPGGGASTVAANLAAAMALNDLRVLLVDANFYRPSLHRIFKNVPQEGLTDVLANPQALPGAVLALPELPRLHVMGVGGKVKGASSELFESKAFRELLDTFKSKYDLILFDGAPLNLVSDSLVLASRVDGVVSVVRAGEVSRGAVVRVRDQIRGVHGNLLGFILNAAKTSTSGYFKENYRTYQRYAGKNDR